MEPKELRFESPQQTWRSAFAERAGSIKTPSVRSIISRSADAGVLDNEQKSPRIRSSGYV
jgi:hypothetical protein